MQQIHSQNGLFPELCMQQLKRAAARSMYALNPQPKLAAAESMYAANLQVKWAAAKA